MYYSVWQAPTHHNRMICRFLGVFTCCDTPYPLERSETVSWVPSGNKCDSIASIHPYKARTANLSFRFNTQAPLRKPADGNNSQRAGHPHQADEFVRGYLKRHMHFSSRYDGDFCFAIFCCIYMMSPILRIYFLHPILISPNVVLFVTLLKN